MRGARSPLIGVLVAGGILWLLAATAIRAGAEGEANLALGEPRREGEDVFITYELSGIFDEDSRIALQSGLAATLVFAWELRRQRSGWWDSHVLAGTADFRILFDVLEERYDLFDESGRRIATCPELDEVELMVCRDQRITLGPASDLAQRHQYYVEMEACLVPLDVEEIRDLEGWLRGGLRGGGDNVVTSLSQTAVGVLKDMVGLGSRSIWARSKSFRGWGVGD